MTAHLSFQYGELTSNPVSVKKAEVSTANVPMINKSLVSVRLKICNTEIEHDIATTLKLQLPPSASVKGFEIQNQQQDQWYPATAVPKQQAAAVVYKEKEKNRDVAVTNVTTSNLFEIGVHPLPYNVNVMCRLEIMASLDETDELIDAFQQSAMSFQNTANHDSMRTEENTTLGSAIVGESFGNTHFVCKIPAILPLNQATTKIPSVSLFWDTSSSAKPTPTQLEARLSRLVELLTTGGTRRMTLHTFGSSLNHAGDFTTVNGLIAAIEPLEYDGGSFFDELPAHLGNLAKSSSDGLDCILIVTDGVDCLDRIPDVGPGIQSPIHCIADSNVVNMRCLRSLIAISTFSGTIFTKADESFVDGVLQPRPVLRSIQTNQSEEAFVQDVDDGFRCVPDHRLGVLNRPIVGGGTLITGILNHGDQQVPCTVSTIVAEVVCGNEVREFNFCLGSGAGAAPKTGSWVKAEVLEPPKAQENGAFVLDAARILGHVHAEAIYAEAESFGLKSGLDMTTTLRQLAETYGFCSPESSLLMLYKAEQFLEHGITPPRSHPLWNSPNFKELFGPILGNAPNDTAGKRSNGIGDHKTDEQLKSVCALARKLQTYFDIEYKAPIDNKNRLGGGRGGGRGGSRGHFLSMNSSNERRSSSGSVDDGFFSGNLERRQCAVPEAAMAFEEECCYGEGGEECCYDEEDGEEASVAMQDMMLQSSESKKSKKRKAFAKQAAKGPTIAKPTDQTQYLSSLERALTGKDKKDWRILYRAQKEALGDFQSVSPSFFLNTARVLSENDKSLDAFRVATNCLETGINDVQMLRSVAYLVVSLGSSFGQRALDLFDKIRELAPCEPQSYLDCALSRFYKCSKVKSNPDAIAKDVAAAQSFLVHVLTHKWADRFNEVEWPAMILLHYIADFVRTCNNSNAFTCLSLVEWPVELKRFNDFTDSVASDTIDSLRCRNFDLALCVWLGWDTDRVDVDLHVQEPSGEEVYYGHRQGVGSQMSRDFTQGYGPEVYLLKSSASKQATVKGNKFKVYAKYFASHQDSLLTGTTSAVVWTVEKKTGLEFRFVRLGTNKEKTHVATVSVKE